METTEEVVPDTEEFTEVMIDEPVADVETTGLAPESVNLAEKYSEEDMKKLGEKVCRDFERDWQSSAKYRERRASILRLFLGDLPAPVNGDELAHAQIHYPIIAKAILRIHARIYDQQFPSNGEFYGVKPTDADDMDRAIRIAKHLNWQISHQIPEYVPNHDALIMQWLLYGSAFSYMYWDPYKNRPCHEVCATEDIVLPYKRKSTDPSLGDMPRITRVLRKYRHELEEFEDGGYYSGVTELFEDLDGRSDGEVSNVSQDEDDKHAVQDVIDRDAGVKKPEYDPDMPRKLLEQHRWYKLPGEKRQRPVTVTVDKDTKRVLCLKLREDEDPQDRARYNREQDANMAAYAAAMVEWQANMAAYETGITAPPIPGDATMTAPPIPGDTTSTGPVMPMAAPPPEPPELQEPAPVRMVPINFFTHYVCNPNPEGVYGFGIGSLLEGHNMAADTMASQVIDAATLANTIGGFISRQFKASRDDLKFRPGEFVETDTPAADLDKMIKIIQFPGPEPEMGKLIDRQGEEAEALAGSSEILSGEVGGSNETATTTQIRMSAAMQAIGIMNKRYTRARTVEGQHLARLNSVHLDEQEFWAVVDPLKGGPQGAPPVPPMAPPMAPPVAPPPPPMQGAPGAMPGGPPVPPITAPLGAPAPMPETERVNVARMDYLEDVDITITADPRMASQPQRFQEAVTIMNIVNSTPALQAMPAVVIAAARLVFKAIDNTEMTKALAMALAMPVAPPGMAPPGPGGPPPEEGGGGPPQPEDPGPAVPNAGPQPANGTMTT